jgi:hypothetical protein
MQLNSKSFLTGYPQVLSLSAYAAKVLKTVRQQSFNYIAGEVTRLKFPLVTNPQKLTHERGPRFQSNPRPSLSRSNRGNEIHLSLHDPARARDQGFQSPAPAIVYFGGIRLVPPRRNVPNRPLSALSIVHCQFSTSFRVSRIKFRFRKSPIAGSHPPPTIQPSHRIAGFQTGSSLRYQLSIVNFPLKVASTPNLHLFFFPTACTF